ncbi:uncharacterized protein LOC125331485 isoform X2 [Corvus hawaiiensis]|uniref:uncharacterized protein LOC125331485 isoform X2 n=1 Tax=Corvus hawaiiensis TaxID=134902 RepID=UPI002018BA63|nr:uncharacterized protein LOC125331485 isoform X2 [Corvus hawaiiensis]
MRRCRGAGLAALAAVLLVAADTEQVQQGPWAETTENTGLNLTCLHPKITADSTHWYRQFPDQPPQLVATAVRGTKAVLEPEGSLWVSADRRSSALWLRRPRRGDAAVYYCALGDTGRGAGAAAGHEPPRAGPGGAGAAAPPAASRGRCRSAAGPQAAPQLLPAQRPRAHRARHSPARPPDTRLAQPAPCAYTLGTHCPASPPPLCLLCLAGNCCGLRLCHGLWPSGRVHCSSQPALQSRAAPSGQHLWWELTKQLRWQAHMVS